MINLFNPVEQVQKIKAESLFKQEQLTKEKIKEQTLNRSPNYLHKDGRIYSSKPGEPYYAVTVSPFNKNFSSQIEPGIFPIVKILLDKNYLPVSSCEGHGSIRFSDPPTVRIAFGSEESAKDFINFFENVDYISLKLLEKSANVMQYYENGQFRYMPIDVDSIVETPNDVNNLFMRNYTRVWYVNLQIIPKLSAIELLKDMFFKKVSDRYRAQYVNLLVEKLKMIDPYPL